MKKHTDELRQEYDLSKLKGCVRGKYAERYRQGVTKVILLGRYELEVFWSEEDGGYIATCPDIPGLSAFGETEEAALQEGESVLRLFFEEWEKGEGRCFCHDLEVNEDTRRVFEETDRGEHLNPCKDVDELLTSLKIGNR